MKVYILEQHAGYWRLRREGNKTGTMRSYNREVLREWGLARGWEIKEDGPGGGSGDAAHP